MPLPLGGTSIFVALCLAAFLGGLLVGLGLRRSDPPHWWERPWPTGPAPEPSFGEGVRLGR